LSEQIQIKEFMLLLLYPKLSSLINNRCSVFNLSHHVCFSNNLFWVTSDISICNIKTFHRPVLELSQHKKTQICYIKKQLYFCLHIFFCKAYKRQQRNKNIFKNKRMFLKNQIKFKSVFAD